MVALSILFTLITLQVSTQIELHISYEASSNVYSAIPKELQLLNVAVFTRHGDRAQITRALSPLHPESANVTTFWRSKLPLEKTLQTMTRYAIPFIHEENMSRKDLILSLYTGHDQHHTPYAQLTEKGALQLQSVGRELRRRYIGSLLPEKVEEASSVLFCRSTNICRTVQSLRSLLVGMYGDAHESSPSFFDSRKGTENRSTVNSNIADRKRDRKLPFISTRHKSFETMFPHADGPCQHMSERRVKLYHQFVNSTALLKWGDLEKRMLEFIGSSHKRIGWLTWLNILDVFTCFQAHNVEFPLGITKVDLQDITELVAWTWDVLYADYTLSRLALGRFIWEAVSNLDTVLNYSKNSVPGADFVKTPNPLVPINFRRKLNINFSVASKDFDYTDDIHSNDFNNKLRNIKIQNKEFQNIQKSIKDNDKDNDRDRDESNNLQQRVKLMTNENNTDSNNFSKNKNGSINNIENHNIYDNSKHDQHNNKHIHSKIKMLIYSGHDSTMVPLLRAFGLYNSEWPPYASYLTLETAVLNQPSLEEGTGPVPGGIIGGIYVRAVYNDKERVMDGCKGQMWCPYGMFRAQALKWSMTHTEYIKECRNPT